MVQLEVVHDAFNGLIVRRGSHGCFFGIERAVGLGLELGQTSNDQLEINRLERHSGGICYPESFLLALGFEGGNGQRG